MNKEIKERLEVKSNYKHEKRFVIQVLLNTEEKEWLDTKYGGDTIEGARITAERLIDMEDRWMFNTDRKLRIVKARK